MAIPHPLRRSAWAIRATMTDVECFSLLAVLVYVADEHPALKASAWPFEASVVRLYSVVVILGGWVRVGCARLFGVHRAPSLWAGLRGVSAPPGPFLYPTPLLYRICLYYV
jgi:hypothetical protein